MTQEENKLIAKFMNLTQLEESKWINPVLSCSTDYLAYHESWGWLMPVIEKIAEYSFPDGDKAYMRTFHSKMARINRFSLHEGATQIEAAYKAVLEFINFYNLNTLK